MIFRRLFCVNALQLYRRDCLVLKLNALRLVLWGQMHNIRGLAINVAK
jgi:hypothetical protein